MSWVLVSIYAPSDAKRPIVNVYGPFDTQKECRRVYEFMDVDGDPHRVVYARRTINADPETGFVR